MRAGPSIMRTALQAWRVARWLLAWLLLATPSVQAAQTLRVLAWPGYADPDWVARFEQQFDAKVELTLVASDDVLLQKVSAGQGAQFDVVAANTVELARYMDQRLLQPLNPALLPNVQRQLPRFRDARTLAGITRGGQVFAVPYTYAEMGLIYDRAQLPEPPATLAVLWDARWRGKVLAFDGASHNFSLAALVAGATPFRIDAAQWQQRVRQLIDLRRNVLAFYSLPEESVALFQQHKVALLFANYGQQQLKALRDAGADVGYTIAKEGALAWLDCWAISARAGNAALAHAWINTMISAEVSLELTRRQGLANTLELPDNTRSTDHLWWLQPVEDAPRRSELWQRILSGDRPEQFK